MRFPILKNQKPAFIFSGILVAASLFFLFVPPFGLKVGIDFTGGTETMYSFSEEKKPTTEEVTQILKSVKGEDFLPHVVPSAEMNGYFIRSHELSQDDLQKISTAFEAKNFPSTLESVSTIGASLGSHFKTQAFYTVGLAGLMIVLFVAWAFRNVPQGISSWSFSIAAIVALLHDVLIIAGVFAFLGIFMQLEVDTLFVTALLTVMGFSVHDTIVVFDRIRENLKGQKAEKLAEIAEGALWQTMGRSIHTSMSVILVLVAVLVFGPSSLFAFVFAITAGILIGTYSSLFIATPLFIILSQKIKANEVVETAEVIG